MRILLIANTLPHTDISGVGEQVVQLATGLVSAGHQVEVLGRGEDGVPGSKLWYPIASVGPFLRRLRSFRPHVVQVHESDGALVALVTKVLQAALEPSPALVALLQVSYVEELRAVRPLHDGDRVLGRPGARELVFRWLKAPIQVAFGLLTAWLADRVLSPSRQTASEIERDYRVDGVEILPNVTGAAGAGGPGSSTTSDSGYWLFVGRLRIRKGLEVLLHALARSDPEAAQAPPLLVVGDGEHRPRIEAVVKDLGLTERVRLLGRVDSAAIQELMSGARALIVPSIYEGMPLVILEAMAAALPVVASRVSGVPEVVEDGKTGWLVPPEDVTALDAALQEIVRDPREARARGERGRERVARMATPADAARCWESRVAPLVGEAGAGG